MLRIAHVSPTFFAPESVVGGGERFAEQLGRAMSLRAQVRFISFGRKTSRVRETPTFEKIILRDLAGSRMSPFSFGLLSHLCRADIIHCHQYFVLPTFVSTLFGWCLNKPVFVTDLGGAGWTPGYRIDQSRFVSLQLPISAYAASRLNGSNKAHHVIFAGVDQKLFNARTSQEHDGSAVFLGRVLPHKGVHYLIEGLPEGMPLRLIGPHGDTEYLEHLKRLARNKSVMFMGTLTDLDLSAHLKNAMAIVHPTPVDSKGDAGINELFGLAVVEGMACGSVPIVTRAASLPELVVDGESGYIVSPNSAAEIRDKLVMLRDDKQTWSARSVAATKRAGSLFGWEGVVERCFEAYRSVGVTL